MRTKDFSSISKSTVLIFSMLGISLILVLFIIFSKPLPTYEKTEIFSLGTYVRIYIAGGKVSSKSLLKIAEKEIERLYAKYSSNIPSSVVYQLNEKREIECDEESLFLFQAAVNVSKITGDSFDPTLRPVLMLWGFDDVNSSKRVPSSYEIEQVLPFVSYKFIDIDSKNRKIKLLKEGVTVDLGGISKGFIVDRVIDRIKEIDPKATGFIDAGGDIGIIGPKFGNRPWQIGIRDPFSSDPAKLIDTLYIYSGAVATSGNYERYFIQNGTLYHHIIDPKTGYPAGNCRSCTVVSDKVMTADAYATGLFVLGIDNPALEYFTKFGVQAYLIDNTGKTAETSGFEYFRNKVK
ncbi:MAG TPA: FAD:protein FMN transferase [Petrotogaceae bacterium]|nr:FAD:protein FMN transferase [Petrotogaceae bacterium]